MKLLYIINGIGFATNVSLGGSDKRAFEIAKRLLALGHQVSVLTTVSAWSLLKDDLNAEYIVIERPRFIGENIKNSFLGRAMAYFYICIISCVRDFRSGFDVVLPTSDFFFDLLPAISAKLRGKARKIVSIVHHKISNPLCRQGKLFTNVVIFILQRISFFLMQIFCDGVFVYATKEGEKIRKIIEGNASVKVSSVLCGIDLEKMKKITPQSKKFTACFVGGLRPAKGLRDIVPIWVEVCLTDKTSKLLIIGGGLSACVEYLRRTILDAGLVNNITLFTGHLEENKLYEAIASSQLLILPSYEEGWGIIVCEALSLGVPAVVYDLDTFSIFSDAVIKARLGDVGDFAAKINAVIKDRNYYESVKNRALGLAPGFDWNVASRLDEDLLRNIAA